MKSRPLFLRALIRIACLAREVRRPWVGMLILCGLSAIGVSCSWQQLYPEMARSGPDAPLPKSCGDCHIEIYKEWKESGHAKAWTNENFVKQTYHYKFAQCLACHAPEPIRDAPTLTLRSDRLEEGVNCIACHLVDGKLAGPHGESAPHPAKGGDAFYRTPQMCGTCHIASFQEWSAFAAKQTGIAKTCQDCHMPTTHRKMIQDPPWHLLHGTETLKRHRFSYTDLELLTHAVKMEIRNLRQKGPQAAVRGTVWVKSVQVGHSLPAGGYGYQEIVLKVTLQDSSGSPIGEPVSQSWFAQTKTHLAPGAERTMPFRFPAGSGGSRRLVVELYKANIQGKATTTIATLSQLLADPPAAGD